MALRDVVRRWLGTEHLPGRLYDIHDDQHLLATRMEYLVTTINEAFATLRTQLNDLRDAQSTSSANLHAAIDRLQAALDAVNTGVMNAEQEAQFVEIASAVADVTAAVTASDDGYEPTPAEPTNPDL